MERVVGIYQKKYRYGWYLHDKEIVAVQVNKTYKR